MGAQQPIHAGGRQAGGHEGHRRAEGQGIGKIKTGQLDTHGEPRGVDQAGQRIGEQHGGGHDAYPVGIGKISLFSLHRGEFYYR